MSSWLDRRREKVVQEILRNRRGGHKVPTWVLAAVLVVIVIAWVSFVLFL